MTIDWLKFLGALVLLLTPTAAFQRKKIRFRSIASDWDQHWGQISSHGLHAIDLSRAALGAWLLADALANVPGTRGILSHGILLTQAATMSLAVVLQTIVCRHPDSFNAPFAFVAGLVLGHTPLLVAGFALVLTVAITAGTRVPAVYFPLLAMALPGMGYLFTGKSILLVLLTVGSVALLPWLLALLFSRDLVVAYRARRPRGLRDDGPAPLR